MLLPGQPFPEGIRERLSSDRLELIELASYNHVKEIVRDRCDDSFQGHDYKN